MTKLSLAYSVKYKVISSFTELTVRDLNPLQPLSALRNGTPVSQAQLTIHKLPLQSHKETPRHAALAETRPFLSLRLSWIVPHRI
jgi:hypothetical protein